jgi:hypothetical protein
VEEIGTEIVGVMRDDPMTVFFVNPNDMRFEAFGTAGRLWKTDVIGSGGFRRMAITDHNLVGEARRVERRGAQEQFQSCAHRQVVFDEQNRFTPDVAQANDHIDGDDAAAAGTNA